MIAQDGKNETRIRDEPGVEEVEAWAKGLEHLGARIGRKFARIEARERAVAYLKGLLSPVERKNARQLAEEVGGPTPYGFQHLLGRVDWQADAIRDEVLTYASEYLGDPAGVLVVDQTGFLKKGSKSVGVAKQYSGTAGKIENCQIGVFLAYATATGQTFLDRALYLPREWTEDHDRCFEAGVPEEVAFATKPMHAQRMLERALDAGVPAAWVTGDTVYGGDRRLRMWLEQREQPFVLAVKSNEPLWSDGTGGVRQRPATTIAASIEDDHWQRLSAGEGAKGPRLYDWAGAELFRLPDPGWNHWLLVRRSIDDPKDLAYYVCFSPVDTSREDLVRVAGTRWAIEECIETAKGEVGLDEYEVRKWNGWYRHMTLSLLPHAYLAVTRAIAGADETRKGGPFTWTAWRRTGSVSERHRSERAGDPPAPVAGRVGSGAVRRQRAPLVPLATTTPGKRQDLPLSTTCRPPSPTTTTVGLGPVFKCGHSLSMKGMIACSTLDICAGSPCNS